MSHQEMEMQFADPDWQPGSARGHSSGDQAYAVPVEIKQVPAPGLQAGAQPATRLWAPGPGQTPPTQPTRANANSGTGQKQQKRQGQQRWLLGLLARIAVVVIWATTPLVTRAFHGGWILPLLGVFFLPVTALTYTIVFALGGSVSGAGWLWVVGALLLDLASDAWQTRKGSEPQPSSKDVALSTEGQ